MLSWTTEMSFRLDAEKSFPAGNGMLTSEADEIVEMKFTFWLLIVFSNPVSPNFTAITTFQSEAMCLAAKRIIELKMEKLERGSFNEYPDNSNVVCERVEQR